MTLISDDDLSQAEIDGLLTITGESKKFEAACGALQKRNLLKVALERLDAYKTLVPVQNMPALIEALCNISDSFPTKTPGFLETDLETQASRLVYFGLKREPDPQKRQQILRDAITRSHGLSLPAHLVSMEERVGERAEVGHEFLVDEVALPEFKAMCAEKIRAASKDRSFRQNPRMSMLLWRWSDWATLDEVRTWLATHTSKPRGAVWLLTVLLGEMHSWGAEHRVRYYIQLSTVERFSDVERTTRLLAQLKDSELSKDEARAVREFRRALQRRAAGKSDSAWQNERDYFEEVAED